MDPTSYLTERVSKVVLHSDKIFNEGARLLAYYEHWREDLPSIIEMAWDTLMRYCIRNKSATYSAAVKLTFASDLIGKKIAKTIGVDHTNIKNTLSLGDLLLETFLQDNLVEIYREYEGIKAPYMVRITNQSDDIKPVLIGTSFEPLSPITNLHSDLTKEPFIKGWSDNKLFKQFLNTNFIRALENLRNQQWEINKRILEAAQYNPAPKTLELVDSNGEIHTVDVTQPLPRLRKVTHLDGTPFLGNADPKLQRLFSKHFEYNQVITKAEMVMDNGGKFFQEVSCDYRGRVYYAESFLEFQGGDLARSLFLFANKKKVTEQGFRWMLIHAANSYNKSFHVDELPSYFTTDYKTYLQGEGLDTISLDKMTLEDRRLWAMNNLVFITDTAFHEKVCDEAEKPYAFLAVCYEIRDYLKETQAKKDYYSGLPIPVDGSNNGKPTCHC